MDGVRIETLRLPVADLGPANPLPPLDSGPVRPFEWDTTGPPAELAPGMAYGHVANLMPYLVQDGYDRRRRPGELRVAVLENAALRATFALDLGGRLWSLVHKGDASRRRPGATERELLYRNPVFQPANLALRNAWFSGGVEWNIGTRGHSPTTCEPLHAAVVDGPGGTPLLRMWQWERLRGVAFQVDAWLTGDVLLVQVRIRNPNRHATPMYWWSNIAVPQTPGVRVLAPAATAYRTGYDGGIAEVAVPVMDGRDQTYPERAPRAADLFFRIPDGVRPWIAALDADGTGLAHTSTSRLYGRKLFVWGESPGGRRWQNWLSGDDAEHGGYLEIQAGLARTQYEHVPMPAGAEWSWVEAYGRVEADPVLVHGADWGAACDAVAAAVHRLAPAARLDQALATATGTATGTGSAPAATSGASSSAGTDTAALPAAATGGAGIADRPPRRILQAGDGWGALERRRRALTGEPAPDSPGTPFPDETLGLDQRPFLALLETGDLPPADPGRPPSGYVTGSDWQARLAGSKRHWASLLHLGVTAHAAGDHDTARTAYLESLRHSRTPWALRNLALLSDPRTKADLLTEAHHLAPALRHLALEAGEALLAAGRPEATRCLLDHAPSPVRDHGRCRLLAARAALAAGDLDRAGELLESGIEVPDVREGEVALYGVWREYRAHRLAAERGVPVDDAVRAEARAEPVPARYDFRMRPES